MRQYLDVPRFYSNQYPLTGITEKMVSSPLYSHCTEER